MPGLPKVDDLADFEARAITFAGNTKTVYVGGQGPAVIVMHEMPGIIPHVARFARWVRDAGFSVYMPSLFGEDGVEPSAEEGGAVFRRACISAEFRALGGGGAASPITAWLAALARLAADEQGGPVGAVGMCFTGNFAVTLMLEPAVEAAVACQPALPLDNPAGLELSDGDLARLRERLEKDDLEVRAYRFAGDAFCRAERFAAYAHALGERFVGTVLPNDAAAKENLPPFTAAYIPTPHSVVTTHLVDRHGEPTIAARDDILSFLQTRLGSRSE